MVHIGDAVDDPPTNYAGRLQTQRDESMTGDASSEGYDRRSHLRARATDALAELAFVAPQLAQVDYPAIARQFEDEDLQAIQEAAEQLRERAD
ncbi:hypothetical protein [Natronococcus sp. A-GB7]|uniref:hypothetical protein n=1 Tax=Natronococcus sp. A-GB7 TaxID=3037649 RepID=UPI00241D22AF|nr:hypothetical protein [Natronococcus sp. A-GB7]MDG5818681.1 hypothetical protein [Natronococcus sp. A-GB7]